MIQTIHIPRSAPWLPPSLLNIPGEIRHRFNISDAEKRIFRKHKKIPVSSWSEKHRYVTMSVLPGRWKNDVTSYLAGIMDASFFPSVQTIIICKAPQVGGSESVLNCIGYAIDRDPGPVLCVYPDELTARENSQDRIQPMITSSPRLHSYFTGSDDDSGILRIKLAHMPIYMAWARSAARLANKPIRYVIFDEVDKYPETVGKKETDPISLGEARTITYRYNCKKWKISTPTVESGNIWKALTKEAQVIFDYHVTCPFCGHHHKMKFNGIGENGEYAYIKWPHKETPDADGKTHSLDPETIESEKLAWYECPHCTAHWNDYDRDRAVRHGKWRDRIDGIELMEYLRVKRPMKIGFHIPSRISPFISFSTIAAAFLRGQSDINKKKDFYNKHEAEPWKITIISKDEAGILAAKTNLPPQTVPENAIALTCGVDVQLHGFWFVVRAWSPELTNWNIHHGFLPMWEDIEKLIFESKYPVSDTGRTMRIFRACVDTGGGEKYNKMSMTDETYLWLIKNHGRNGVALWGTKGSSRPLPEPLALGNPILSTSNGKKLSRALRLLIIDTERGKDQYHQRLQQAAAPDTRELPGSGFLHSATGSDYAGQILSEEKIMDERGNERWVNVHQRPNHYLDGEVLAGICVETAFPGGGLRLLYEALKNNYQDTKVIEKTSIAKSNWMNRK
jgi:phage terminase large subunit GpA-like protein